MKRTFYIAVILCILISVGLSFGFAGCTETPDGKKANTPQINPNVEAANYDTSEVTLYYCYRNEFLLAPETRAIDVPVSDTIEAAVIRELIAGPSADKDELSSLFWEGVELVRVNSTGDYLFITLSEDFVVTEPNIEDVVIEEGTAANQKCLAIYSMVNTIIEMGTYSRVQLYVDRKGTGQRITLEEAGWPIEPGDEPGDYLDLLGRTDAIGNGNDPILLTPENTVKEALDSFAKKDWERLYNFTAYSSPDGTIKPEIEDFSEALAAKGNVLDSYDTVGVSVAANGQTAIVMLDYTIKTREGDLHTETNIPVMLVREKDIWKLTYLSLATVLVNS